MPNDVLYELIFCGFQLPLNLVAQHKDLPFSLFMSVTLLLALLPQKKKITHNSYCSLLLHLQGAVGSKVHVLLNKGFFSHRLEDLGSTVSMERGCLQLASQRRGP